MALINCPECENQVSNTAVACPKCGAPIAGALEASAAGAALTTIQETSKRLKLHIIFSSLFFLVGVIWVIGSVNSASASGEPSPIPGLLIFIGLIWYIVTRFRIWWHHK